MATHRLPYQFCKCNDPHCPASGMISEIRETTETIGLTYTDLEKMGGTTVMGTLAIKNNMSMFLAFMQRFCHIPEQDKELTPEILTASGNLLSNKDLYGNTPMHYWAARGEEHKDKIPLLLAFGGCLCIENNAGERAVDILRTRKMTLIADGDALGVSYDTEVAKIVAIVPSPRKVTPVCEERVH